MNLLGHAQLSYPHVGLLVGNFIEDFVYGGIDKLDYAEPIKQGIKMHRAIDTFTDKNVHINAIKKIFKKDFGRYDAVISDVVIDYFLANDETIFPTQNSLHFFSENVYRILLDNKNLFVEEGKQMIEKMSQEDWLTRYRQEEGISKSLSYVIYKAKYLETTATAKSTFELMLKHKQEIEKKLQLIYKRNNKRNNTF